MTLETNAPNNLRILAVEQMVRVWKRKWLVLAVTWALCIVGWTAATFVPLRFESDARAFVDVNGLLTPLLKGLIVNSTPADSENYLRQTLISRPNLQQVIVMANLGPPTMSDAHQQQLIDQLSKSIKVTTEGQNLVSISYFNKDPAVAKSVVEALLTIFAEKAATSSRAEMDKARQFLGSQIEQYGNQLRAEERRRAAFRKQYARYFDDAGIIKPDSLQQRVRQLAQQYEDAVTTRKTLSAQMKQIPALLSVNSAPAVADNGQIVAASPEVRLAQAKRHLADLRLNLTDKHPDVIEAEHNVANLQGELAAKPSGTSEGKAQIPNPTYQQLKLKLVDAETVVPTLKLRLDKASEDYAAAKLLSADLPEIQAKSQDIDRDYDVLKHNYDELVKRRESANLSQAADDRADRTQFRVVDPPQLPRYPSFPDRLFLMTIATLMALGAGIASPILLDRIHPTYGTPAQLRKFGLPVIGTITFAPRPALEDRLTRVSARLYALCTVALFAAYGGVMVFAGAAQKRWW